MEAAYKDMTCDVVIAGCGVAGLYAALNLPSDMRVHRRLIWVKSQKSIP